jgi:hypothetical protein
MLSYDPEAAERVRHLLSGRGDVVEKKTVGGVSFLVNGNNCCGFTGRVLMVRIGAESREEALREPHVQPMLFGGRTGFIYVEPAGYEGDDALARWVQRALDSVCELPAKPVRAQSRAAGLAERAAGWTMKVIGMSGLWGAVWAIWILGWSTGPSTHSKLGNLEWFALILFFFAAGYWIFGAGRDLDVSGRRHLAPILNSPRQLPDRSFVLYLRSFKDDELRERVERPLSVDREGLVTYLRLSRLTQEEQLVSAFRSAGRVVSLGRPGERLPRLGALRIYSSDDTWQEMVLDLLRRARLVVIALGAGRGLEWELLQAVRVVAPERLLLLVLMPRDEYERQRKVIRQSFDLEARRLRATGCEWSPPVLPRYPRKLGESVGWIIQFNRTWAVNYLALSGLDDWEIERPGASSLGSGFQDSISRALRPVFRGLAEEDGLEIRSRVPSRTFLGPVSLALLLGTLAAVLGGAYFGVEFAIGITAGIIICGVVGILISGLSSGKDPSICPDRRVHNRTIVRGRNP